MEHVPLFEIDVGQAELILEAFGRPQTPGTDVDPGHPAGAVAGEDDAENARAASGIEDAPPRSGGAETGGTEAAASEIRGDSLTVHPSQINGLSRFG